MNTIDLIISEETFEVAKRLASQLSVPVDALISFLLEGSIYLREA